MLGIDTGRAAAGKALWMPETRGSAIMGIEDA